MGENLKEKDRVDVGKLAEKILYKFGFSFLMVLHMLRYSKEEKISTHEIIQIFKDNSISPNYVAYISYGGYESFKRLVSMCKEE